MVWEKKIEVTDLFFESLKNFYWKFNGFNREEKKITVELERKKRVWIIDYCDGKKNENQI